MHNTNSIHDNEVDLRELVKIISKRKKLIFFISSMVALFSLLYVTYYIKPTYKAETMLKVIYNKGGQFVYDDKQRLEYLYLQKSTLPKIESIKASPKAKSTITLNIVGQSPEATQKYAQDITNKIVEEGQKEQEREISAAKKDLLRVYEKEKAESQLELSRLQQTYLRNKTQENLDAIQIVKQQIADLKVEKFRRYSTMVPRKTIYHVGKIKFSNKPSQPNKLLVVVGAFLASLLFAIMLTFFLEFIKKFKEM